MPAEGRTGRVQEQTPYPPQPGHASPRCGRPGQALGHGGDTLISVTSRELAVPGVQPRSSAVGGGSSGAREARMGRASSQRLRRAGETWHHLPPPSPASHSRKPQRPLFPRLPPRLGAAAQQLSPASRFTYK